MTIVRFIRGPDDGAVMELPDPLHPTMEVPVLMRFDWSRFPSDPTEPLNILSSLYELREIIGGKHDGAKVYVSTMDPRT